MDTLSTELAKDREDNMSSVAAGLAVRMRKRTGNPQRKTTSDSKGPYGK